MATARLGVDGLKLCDQDVVSPASIRPHNGGAPVRASRATEEVSRLRDVEYMADANLLASQVSVGTRLEYVSSHSTAPVALGEQCTRRDYRTVIEGTRGVAES